MNVFYRIKRDDGLYYGLKFEIWDRVLTPMFTCARAYSLPIGTKKVAKAHARFLKVLGYTVHLVKVTARQKAPPTDACPDCGVGPPKVDGSTTNNACWFCGYVRSI